MYPIENKFFCGTSNIVLPVPNKSHYPPEYMDKSRLAYYSSLFNSLEVNSSFYKIPMAKTVERWSNTVTEHFRFSFKLWRGITHSKDLVYFTEDISRFFQAIEPAEHKSGCVLLQFPASIKFSCFQKLQNLLDEIVAVNGNRGWKLAIEFRDTSWYDNSVFQLLEKNNVGLVVHDIPASATPIIDMQAGFIYMRFHGEKGDYRGSYTNDFLNNKADVIKACLAQNNTVFVYFNNTIGDAVHNAFTLKNCID